MVGTQSLQQIRGLYNCIIGGGRGIIGAEDTVRREEDSLCWYIMSNDCEIMRLVEKEGILKTN